MGDHIPDLSSQIIQNPNPNPPPNSSTELGHYNVQQCRQQALFLNDVTSDTAFIMWMMFNFLLQLCLIFAVFALRYETKKALECSRGDIRGSRPFFGTIEKLFIASTVMLGVEAFFVLVLGLLVQVQRYCDPFDEMTQVGFVAEWFLTGLVGGGVLGTVALDWYNALLAVKGEEGIEPYRFVQIVVCLVAAPLVLVGILLVLVVKGPAACRELKVMQSIQDWMTARQRSLMACIKRRGPKKFTAMGAVTEGDEAEMQSHLMTKQAEQAAPPAYFFSRATSYAQIGSSSSNCTEV